MFIKSVFFTFLIKFRNTVKKFDIKKLGFMNLCLTLVPIPYLELDANPKAGNTMLT